MFKVFVEYAINPEERVSYLNYMQAWKLREGRLTLMEGTDQPGLFVEIWDGVSYTEYEELKKQRLQEGASLEKETANWSRWVKGGLQKLHMWHFTES
ncbi:hypothetical protein [Paenibacillus hexagrammi]|uniref:NIPSNAP domain-containing protein n=1 Tax=Paenibacillus hexagrammi TaxID=2908839 RepID=A0ABY3SGJ3_9BACL|nr:hypothetical protein [Paenibacillus sp. YPD9-1]UJF32311.1 hypothetical protein L0M14_21750 [Paenibacillus sp. YPD9-1]